MEQYYTIKQVAAKLSISTRHLYREISRGNFSKPVKSGRSSRYPESSVQAYIKRNNTANH